MPINIVLLIFLAIIWSTVEEILLLKDKSNSKGSTRIDKMTRSFNSIATISALLSAFFIMLPAFNFSNQSILWLTVIGTLLALSGFILRHISIHILGKYFRTTVEIDEGQPVIQTGPYYIIRHPSYSGIILFFIGYGILSENWLCLAESVLLPAVALSYRIKIEEEALVKELGTKYADYQTKTKKIIPFIW
jgi:protein-S-isoprenylcysteine O-methyltransferase Ste14